MKAVTNYITFKNNEELVLKIRDITKQYNASNINVINYELYNIKATEYKNKQDVKVKGSSALLKLIIG